MTETRGAQPPTPTGKHKAHLKDICFTRMYIQSHFNAPFEDYRLDAAVIDLVNRTGVKRSSFLPLTCFVYKGYIWTINNRRLWILRQAFMFTGLEGEVDVIVLPANSMPERKDYIHRLPFHKQELLASPRFIPTIHGEQPRLQRLVLRPILFRFDTAPRNGYMQTVDGRLERFNAADALAAFKATGAPNLPALQPTKSDPSEEGAPDDDTASIISEVPSMISVDFPGKVHDSSGKQQSVSPGSAGSFGPAAGVAAVTPGRQKVLGLPSVKEEAVGEGEGEGGTTEEEEEIAEVVSKFKEAVVQMRVVLDCLEAAVDKLAAKK